MEAARPAQHRPAAGRQAADRRGRGQRRLEPRRPASAWRSAGRSGLLFCAIAVAIVVYLLVQGIKLRDASTCSTTPPDAGFSQSETGGFSRPADRHPDRRRDGRSRSRCRPGSRSPSGWSSSAGPAALARVAESTIEAIAGIPSIVLALFGTVIFSEHRARLPQPRPPKASSSGAPSSPPRAMLSLVALPLIVASTREGLQAIPRHVREASYAVGKTKAATTRRILLPAGRPPGRDRRDARPRPDHRRHGDHRRPARRDRRTSPRSKARRSRSTTCAAPAAR